MQAAGETRFVMNKIHLYFELTKPRIFSMVLVTTTLGFFLGNPGAQQDGVRHA
jgi:heme O synthase-like polyprenyltransferase